jgi:hypothetical protein
MTKFDINPFDRSALPDAKLMAGRINELKQIRFVFRNSEKLASRFKHILISGPRGVGKTSFLNLIEDESKSHNLVPIRIDLTESISSNPNEFFWHLFIQAAKITFERDLLDGIDGEIDISIQRIIHCQDLPDIVNWVFKSPLTRKNYLNSKDFPFESTYFVSDLIKIRKAFSNSENEEYNEKTKLLFIVDEAQLIYRQKEIVENIRYLVQNHELGIGFVFAGGNSFKATEWESVFGSNHRDFETINLNYFRNSLDVINYFKKSLESVGWSVNDIKEDLFYRHKRACSQILILTSGNPSWINVIAMKMFERCMKGESRQLKFDRHAQDDVKSILEDSGLIDSTTLDFIENLSSKYSHWLSMIFSCENSTPQQVYFYAKFLFYDQYFLNYTDYLNFCTLLFQNKIIVSTSTLDSQESDNLHDFKIEDIMDQPFAAFGDKSETIKQWLQINSCGQYRFPALLPSALFIIRINFLFIGQEFPATETLTWSENSNDLNYSISRTIQDLNNGSIELTEMGHTTTSFLYSLVKKLAISRDREVLIAELINHNSKKTRTWIIYNHDDNDRIIPFNHLQSKLDRLKSEVSFYNNGQNNYSFNIFFDNSPKPNLEDFQTIILKSGDIKKMGILIDDKATDLVSNYLEKFDNKTSLIVAEFFSKLFDDGHNLDMQYLSNAGYVMMVNEKLDLATKLLDEAILKVSTGDYEKFATSSAMAVIYNYAILLAKKGQYREAFQRLIWASEFYLAKNIEDDEMGALIVVKLNESKDLVFEELTIENTKIDQIRTNELTAVSFKALEEFLGSDLKK